MNVQPSALVEALRAFKMVSLRSGGVAFALIGEGQRGGSPAESGSYEGPHNCSR